MPELPEVETTRRGLEPHLVARVADRAAELLAQRLEHAQVQLLGFARVGARGVREEEALAVHPIDRRADLVHGRHAGREDQRASRDVDV